MQAPDIVRHNKHRAVFKNISEISYALGCSPEDVAIYIETHLGTRGWFDLSGRYWIKGRFSEREMTSVLLAYQ